MHSKAMKTRTVELSLKNQDEYVVTDNHYSYVVSIFTGFIILNKGIESLPQTLIF